MTEPQDNGELAELLATGILKTLVERLKGKATAPELAIARRFLRDHGEVMQAIDEADRKRLASIRKLYLLRLEEALKDRRVSAAVLHEALMFCQAAGIVDGLGPYVAARQALETLNHSDLPFQA